MSSLGTCAFWNKSEMKMLTIFIAVFKFQGVLGFLLKVCCLKVEGCLEKSCFLLVLNEKGQNFGCQEGVCSLCKWLCMFYSIYMHVCICGQADLETN